MKKIYVTMALLTLASNVAEAQTCSFRVEEIYHGPGYETQPTDQPEPGLPDFITDKVVLSSGKSWRTETYRYPINAEKIYIHSWTDNIGDTDWEGDVERIQLRAYFSSGQKIDSHDDRIRVRKKMYIKRGNLRIKKKPKHERTDFNLLKLAREEGDIYPGNYYNIVVYSDRTEDHDNGDGDVLEKHKSNNRSTEAVFYIDFAELNDVDLITHSLALTDGVTALRGGDEYGLEFAVQNYGSELPYNGFRSVYQIKGPGTGGVWQTVADDGSKAYDVPPGGMAHWERINKKVKAPMVGGDYTFRVCADYQQVVPETDENNNCTELDVHIAPPPRPDLIVESLALTNNRTSLRGGDLFGLGVNIKNIGEITPKDDFRTSYEIKGPGTNNEWQFVADDGSDAEELYPGAVQHEYISDGHGAHIPVQAGTYTARACTDYRGEVQESNEGNNCIEFQFEVTAPPLPDLTTHSLSLTGGRSYVTTGEKFGFSVGVENIGEIVTPDGFRTSYELKGPSTGGKWQYIDDDGSDADELTPGRTQWEAISEQSSISVDVVGIYTARACTDYLKDIVESDEGNNCSSFSFEVR